MDSKNKFLKERKKFQKLKLKIVWKSKKMAPIHPTFSFRKCKHLSKYKLINLDASVILGD